MRGLVISAAAFVALTLAGCERESPVGVLMPTVGVQDARDLLTEAGARVEKVEFGADSFTVTAAITPGRHAWFEGLNCKGAAEAKTCTEFKISARWELETPARAAAIAKQLNYNYTSVSADGTSLELWRMDFTYGGITREHLRDTLLELLTLRQQAEDTIWPPTVVQR